MGSKFKIVLCLLISLSLISNADARTRKGGQQISAKTVLMGVNASSLEAGSNVIPGTINVNYAQPSCAEMSYYHSKGLNIVRLPFLWERVQPTLGGALDTTYLSYITNVVTCAQTYSQKVLLDVHNFGSYNGNKVGSVSGPTYAQFANLWSRLATAFVGNNGVGGYDLMNEPNSMPSAAVVPAMYQAAVDRKSVV